MKTRILIITIIFFSISLLKAQEKTKDTLFFSVDKYYTVSPTISANSLHKTYKKQVEAEKEQMNHTKTNGYIFFVGNGYLTKGLKPKKILSIKDYIENRKFYFDGIHNKIVDRWKLKDSLTNKYIIYFVNGDEFIQPRYLEYQSYYPLRDKNWNIINNKVADTLFFKFDSKYINTYVEIPNRMYIDDSSGSSDGSFFFQKDKTISNLKPNKVLSLKEFIQSSRFYEENKKQKLKDLELSEYLNNYIIFLVNDEKKEYIQVSCGFAIE
nr:hypothetical protein [uncultured Flavobacterium sp.]